MIESLGRGELVGGSWLFRPYTSHFDAEATPPYAPTSSMPRPYG